MSEQFGRREWLRLLLMAGVFLGFYYLPLQGVRNPTAIREALLLTQSYAREHVLLCLIPALFIAGAVATFINQAAVMRYLGPRAPKHLAYGVAAVAGGILAVCSCTVLPLFAGIYQMGAGLGPAATFLYSGPAINVLAVILSARVLGLELGIARAVGAVAMSLFIGLLLSAVFRRSEARRVQAAADLPIPEALRPLWKNALFFAALVLILIFANWGCPTDGGRWLQAVYAAKWTLTGAVAVALGGMLVAWFGFRAGKLALAALPVLALALLVPSRPTFAFVAGFMGLAISAATTDGEPREWFGATWDFAKMILPLLFAGILVSGLLLGRPGHDGVIPSSYIARWVGGNSLGANLFAATIGVFMYFATLTEVPILQGLIGSGMGSGPALALLLAGPALSLPSMLVIRRVVGTRKALTFFVLVILSSALCGRLFGALVE